MKKSRKTYSLAQLASAIFMMIALLWLTVSVAFIVPAQQQLAQQGKATTTQSCTNPDEEESNPFGNTNEEKASSNSTSFSEEYLHDHHAADHFSSTDVTTHTSKNSGTYNAFHGEVHVPPPNIA
jgi:cytoskeletal protein RodZ